jgi:hypothetical protein
MVSTKAGNAVRNRRFIEGSLVALAGGREMMDSCATEIVSVQPADALLVGYHGNAEYSISVAQNPGSH